MNIKLSYLKWVKDLEQNLHGRDDCFQLLSSAVAEPSEILHRHIKQHYNDLIFPRLEEPNPWGHSSAIEQLGFRYGISEKKILLTYGASNAIYLVIRALLEKDDHVVIEMPVYEPLLAAAEFVGAKVTFAKRASPDFRIDPSAIDRAITNKTKLIILTNLHNPSGAFLKTEELLEISRVAQNHNERINIVVDEIYHDFVINIQPNAASLANNFISISSLTKVYGLALLRCGWVFASRPIIEKIRQLYVMTEGNGSRFLEVISSVVLENIDEYLAHSRELIAQNREVLWNMLGPLLKEEILSPNIPENGCLYFPDVIGLSDTTDFARNLINKFMVYIVPGHFFSEPSHIRIGFGGDTEMLKKSLEKFVEATFKLLR